NSGGQKDKEWRREGREVEERRIRRGGEKCEEEKREG
ncbi:uncharacterized, partial [Tachysurus ichikawai]